MQFRARFLPPRVDPDAVVRPPVQQRLDAAVDAPLTLLVAAPGFGKTTALAAWLATHAEAAVYFAAGPRDADLTRFVTLFVRAIQTVLSTIGDATLDELAQARSPDAAILAETLADELAASTQDVTVVIDDYHAITAPEVHAFIGELLRFGLPSLHLVLASRYDPPFPWARLRLEGRLREIRARDLQLTEQQAGLVLQRAGIPDPAGRLAGIVCQQAEGWPAGIRGLALALTTLPTPFRADALPTETIFSHLDDFLVQEVFIQQPPSVQDALIRLAVAERFDGDLAETLVAEGEAGGTGGLFLAELMNACPYLEPEDDRGWVRFHPLFRRFLRKELAGRYREADRHALSRRAGAALAARGLTDAAIKLLRDAGDLDGAAALVEREMNAALARQDWRLLEGWLGALPQELIEARPWLMVGRAWVSHLSGRVSPLNAYADRIERLIAPGQVDADEIRGICAVLRLSNSLPIDQDPSAAAAAMQRAVDCIPPSNRFSYGLAQCFLSLTLHACGQTDEALRGLARWTDQEVERIDAGFIAALQGKVLLHYWAGQLHACDEAAADVLALANRHDLPIAACWARRGLGMVAYMQNRLEEAAQHFAAAIADHERCNMLCIIEAFSGLARSHAALGRLPEARATLKEATSLALERQAIELTTLLRPSAALLALAEDPPDVAKALGLSEDATIDSGPLNLMLHPLLARVRILLASGRPQDLDEAAAHLTALEERAELSHNVPVQLAVATLGAILHDRRGDRTAALAELGAAVTRGAPQRFLRVFLDLEPLLAPLLLDLARNRDEIAGLPALLAASGGTLAAAVDDLARRPAISPSLEVLTMREAEVLDLLAERLTYKEIAYQLSISPETVKRHVNSIYSKLDVASRREALLKAQELGWHPAA